jgi:hypothetical protein
MSVSLKGSTPVEDETIPADCEYPELSYDERLSNAQDRAREEYMNAMWDNDQVLGILEREYGLKYGTLDEYRID